MYFDDFIIIVLLYASIVMTIISYYEIDGNFLATYVVGKTLVTSVRDECRNSVFGRSMVSKSLSQFFIF